MAQTKKAATPTDPPGQATKADKFAALDKYGLVKGPWDEKADIWLEYLTGEPQGKRRESRDADL
jgi:hypothetical protein